MTEQRRSVVLALAIAALLAALAMTVCGCDDPFGDKANLRRLMKACSMRLAMARSRVDSLQALDWNPTSHLAGSTSCAVYLASDTTAWHKPR